MPTVVGARVRSGVVLAGDRRETRAGQVVSDGVERIHELGQARLATAGPAGDVRELVATADDRRRSYEQERTREPGADPFERIISEVCAAVGTGALLAVPDETGEAILIRCDEDGGSTRERVAALGSGAEMAVGMLDQLEQDIDLEATSDQLTQLLHSVGERDTETGSEIDVAVLADVE